MALPSCFLPHVDHVGIVLLPICDMHRPARLVVVASVLLAAVLSVVTGIAAGALPSSWRPHLWLAWPATLVVAVAYALVEIRRTGELRSPHGSFGGTAARTRLLDRVDRIWVGGVLERSLYQGARLELGLTRTVDAPHPWGLASAAPDTEPEPVPPGTALSDVFRTLDQAMLILGQPGSGKTTTMLELLRELLTQARADNNASIPVFLPLASWAVSGEPIAQWILREVSERYGIPPGHVQSWLHGEQLLPLLDGLDEVAAQRRQECVEAINAFRQEYGTVPIAVCCRTRDYQQFTAGLSLYGTLSIQPLGPAQVERFLDRGDGLFSGVLAALDSEPRLWELAETPLALSIMILAFRDQPSASDLERNVPGGLLDQLFAIYIKTMLAHRHLAGQPPTSTVRKLGFIARQLQRNQQTMFSSDLLDPNSIPDTVRGEVVGIASFALFGVFNALVMAGALTVLYDWRGAVVGALLGLLSARESMRGMDPGSIARMYNYSLAYDMRSPDPVSDPDSDGVASEAGREEDADDPDLAVRYQYSRWSYLLEGSQRALAFILPGVVVGVLLGLPHGFSWMLAYGAVTTLAVIGVEVLMRRTMIWKVKLPVRALISDFTSDFPSPALRFYLLKRALPLASKFGVLFGVAAGLLIGWWAAPRPGLLFGLGVGFCVFFFICSRHGGVALFGQAAIRLMLRWADLFPIPSRRFLEYAVQCLFLQQAGGGYMFVHRSLQEFFSSLCPPDGDDYVNEPDPNLVQALIPE
jgi:hypothetical protein